MIEVTPLIHMDTFRRVFSQPDVFCQFASDLLEVTVAVDHVETAFVYPKTIGDLKTEYDLFADDKEREIIVAIQQIGETDLFNRFVYSHMMNLIEQVKGLGVYRFDRTVYTIIILTGTLQDHNINSSFSVLDMNPIDEFNRTVELFPHRLVVLTPRLLNDQTPPKVKTWLQLIQDSLDCQIDETAYHSPIFQKVIRGIEKKPSRDNT
jgi:hypothetical protein